MSTDTARPVLEVCAAVIERGGRYLLARRPPGSHLAGAWEFPGGKVRGSEDREACIRREIREELDLEVVRASLLVSIRHDYPEKRVHLHFLACVLAGDARPRGCEGQQCDWFSVRDMASLDLAPADRRFVEWLRGRGAPGTGQT